VKAIEPGRIRARDLGRRFSIAAQGGRSLKATVLRREHAQAREFWAVRHVDLDIMPGETFGIVGRNGSGKSTLLKMLARIFGPSEGDCQVGGRLSSLLELGAGFHPEFSAVENIYMSAAIYGIPRDEVVRDIESILDFAELDAFKDQPVKTFSSGMFARLGFSVAMHVKPDVLLLDEVLAVGDEAFVQKCMGRLAEYRRNGGTMILVTHDAGTVERVCDRALLLEHGLPVISGAARDVIREYHRRLAHETAGAGPPVDAEAAVRGDTARGPVARLRITGAEGLQRSSFVEGEPMQIAMTVDGLRGTDQIDATLRFTDETGRDIAASRADGLRVRDDGTARAALELPTPPFREGTFTLDLELRTAGSSTQILTHEGIGTVSFMAADSLDSGSIRLKGVWADDDGAQAGTATADAVPSDDGPPSGATTTARDLAESRLELASARKEASLAEDEVAEMRLELGILRDQVVPIQLHAQIQSKALQDVITSPTWRITEALKAPLRAVGILTHPRGRAQGTDILEPTNALDSGSVPMSEVQVVHRGPASFAGQNVAIIAAYDVRRLYGTAVEHMVASLAAAGWRTVVSYSTAIDSPPDASERTLPDVLIMRDHAGAGWDFFSWRVAFETCPELRDAQRILVLNDSMIGPIAPIEPLLARLIRSTADVVGLAEAADPIPHLQSWGVAFAGRAISSGAVEDFYQRAGLTWPKEDVIGHMEIPLGAWFARRDYLVEVVCSPAALAGERRNPSIFGWEGVIRTGVPLVKRELFTMPMDTIGKRPVQVLRSAQKHASIDLEPIVRDSVASSGKTLDLG
jgi:ABC-2 type transport system ATP-binding protein